MSLARIRKPTLIVLSLLLALAVLSLAPQPAAPAQGSNAIALKAPSFVSVANAQDAPDAAPMGFPQDEAGISAYFKSASSVTLADVRSVYRVIEVETADYIIGSVPVPDYKERFDVHLYVHRNGWFLAYYLASDPVSKIFDWLSYSGGISIPTIPDRILQIAATSAGMSFPGSTYYDFRYPNATNLMLVAETTANGNDFTIYLPGSYGYYERSWSTRYTGGNYGTCFLLNGTQIGCAGSADGIAYGSLTAAQLLPDTTHSIQISSNGYGGLALLYRVP